jgi:hypothetical protein
MPTARSLHRRQTIRRTSLSPDPQEESPLTGIDTCIVDHVVTSRR